VRTALSLRRFTALTSVRPSSGAIAAGQQPSLRVLLRACGSGVWTAEVGDFSFRFFETPGKWKMDGWRFRRVAHFGAPARSTDEPPSRSSGPQFGTAGRIGQNEPPSKLNAMRACASFSLPVLRFVALMRGRDGQRTRSCRGEKLHIGIMHRSRGGLAAEHPGPICGASQSWLASMFRRQPLKGKLMVVRILKPSAHPPYRRPGVLENVPWEEAGSPGHEVVSPRRQGRR